MDKNCQHYTAYNSGQNDYYFFTWSIPEISVVNHLNVISEKFRIRDNNSYCACLFGSERDFTFKIASSVGSLKCFFSMVIGSKTLLREGVHTETRYFNSSYYYYDLVTLTSKDECFQELKRHPDKSLSIICKIKHPKFVSTASIEALGSISTDYLYNLRQLKEVFKTSSEASLLEKVVLQVGEEAETVSKAVLCAMSPVFAKMFETDSIEIQENKVTIEDIEMSVLKVFISFLYTGKLPDSDVDLLCDLYYVADKYDVTRLRRICVDLIIPRISMENVYRVIKLAFTHEDELLKSSVLAFMAMDLQTWFFTKNWMKLINNEPKIAAKVINFFVF